MKDGVLYIRIPKPILAILIVIRSIVGTIRREKERGQAEDDMVKMLGRDGKPINFFKYREKA